MKNLLLGLVLGILLASVPLAYTQQEPERISVGAASLQLGMEKNAVISKLAELGYKLNKFGPSSEVWAVTGKDQQTDGYPDYLGNIYFKNARLSWAERVWAESRDAGSNKIGRNLYFLMKSFQDSGNTTCSIESTSHESPDHESKESVIHCGRRTIELAVNKYKERLEVTQLTEIVR